MKSYKRLHFFYTNVFLLALFIFLVGTVYSQANNTITGFVQGNEREPVNNAAVELSDDFHRLISRITTDGAGRYSFFRLPLGRYSIRVTVLGSNYDEQSVDVEIISASRSTSSSETIQQNFTLRIKNKDGEGLRASNGVIFAQDIPKGAQVHYENGLSAIKDKKIDLGISELKIAISIFPHYYLALDRLGELYIEQLNFKDAVVVLNTAIETNPRSFSSQYGLAYSLCQTQQTKEALAVVDKSLEVNPSSVNALFLRGVILKRLGLYKEAVESLKLAKKKSTEPPPDIYWQLSLIYTNNLKQYGDAAKELELFLKAKPNYSEADKVRDLIKKLRAKPSE